MKKIKIAACLMAFAFLFTGCKKEEIEGGSYEKKINISSLKEYNDSYFQPFEELDFEFYITSDEDFLYLRSMNTSKLNMYEKYINEDGSRHTWSKNDSPQALDDWYSGCSQKYVCHWCSRYILMEIRQDGQKYYGWIKNEGDILEIVVSKTPNHILAVGCKD